MAKQPKRELRLANCRGVPEVSAVFAGDIHVKTEDGFLMYKVSIPMLGGWNEEFYAAVKYKKGQRPKVELVEIEKDRLGKQLLISVYSRVLSFSGASEGFRKRMHKKKRSETDNRQEQLF